MAFGPLGDKKLFTLCLGIFLIYLAFLPPGIYSVDENSMLAVSESIVLHHSVSVPVGLGMSGRNGETYSSWYPLLSVLAMPIVAPAIAAARLVHVQTHYVEGLTVPLLSMLCTAGTAGFVVLISLELGSTPAGAWTSALVYGFGTIAIVYARTFYAEPLLALIVAASMYLAFQDKFVAVFALAFFAVLAKPAGIVLGPVLAVFLILKRREFWPALMPAIGSALGLGVYCAYNTYRFAHPFTFGQPWGLFSLANVPEASAGILFSPGAGIVWYCPCLILAVVGIRKIGGARLFEGLAIAGVFAAFVALHSCWGAWNGGWAWGPRLILPAFPGLAALTGVLRGKWRTALVTLAVIGFLISAPTLFSFHERYLAERLEQGAQDDLMWQPVLSPLLHAWPAAFREIDDARRSDVRELFRERGASSVTISESRALRIVAVWWWLLPIFHISRVFGIALSAVLTAAGIWMLGLSRPECER